MSAVDNILWYNSEYTLDPPGVHRIEIVLEKTIVQYKIFVFDSDRVLLLPGWPT